MASLVTLAAPHPVAKIEHLASRLRRRLAAVRYYNLAWLAWQAGDRLLGEMTYRVAREIESGKVPAVRKLPSPLLSYCRSDADDRARRRSADIWGAQWA
jgi:hypothetical protein